MRRYGPISGILLILSIVDFALAAPALVQEKRQASVVVSHTPKDVITVLGKRWNELELLETQWKKYFDDLGHLEESSSSSSSPATHSSSSSAPSSPDHGSTNVAQAPQPNPASPDHGSTNVAQAPQPNPASPTANLHQWDDVYSYKGNDGSHGPLYTPTSSAYASSGYGSDQEFAKAHAPEPNSNPWSSTDSDSSTDPDFDWNDPLAPPPRPASPNEFGQASEHHAENSPSPNLESPKEPAGTHN
jgi:hypothetical protein